MKSGATTQVPQRSKPVRGIAISRHVSKKGLTNWITMIMGKQDGTTDQT